MGSTPPKSSFASALVAVIAQPAAILDCNGTIVSCNADFLSCLSLPDESSFGTPICALLRAPDQGAVQDFFKTPQSDRREFLAKVTMASGQFKLTLDALSDHEQGVLYLCQLTTDLAIDSSRLRFLLEHLDQGVWNYNILAGTFNVTDAWRRMRGVPLDGDVNTPHGDNDYWLADIHEDDREMVQTMFDGQISGAEKHINMQYRRWHHDGYWIWILVRASVMLSDQNGRPVQIVGLDTDITSIKQNEAQLTQLTSKLQLAIEAAGIGIWEFDLDSGQGHWDEKMFELYGIKGDMRQYISDIWESHLHPDDAEETKRYAQRCLADYTDFNRDYRILRDDGEVRHMRSLARLVRTPGKGGKMLGVNIDVSDDYRRAEELEKARGLLEYDSRHDALTGLANRRLLDETMQSLLADIGARDRFAVLHIDLDHFKQINDRLGHAAGDEVLVLVANILRELTGDQGLVCRIGGDEFVVLLHSVAAEQELYGYCQSIIARMAEPALIQGQTTQLGLSIGCALGRGDVEDASEVFINADVALYAAKSDGRSCFRVFAPGLHTVASFDTHAHHDLVSAMATGQITCHYQPQFDAHSHGVVSAEALVRWACPQRGLLLPQDFMPLAQETGLVPRIDEYVLNLVLDAQTRWHDAGRPVPTIALNISLDRLREPDLIEQVESAILPHHEITFELLETAFLDERDDKLSFILSSLRGLGIAIDLDDFGSGHSSIVALQTVQPDRVKFDQMLIAPLERNPSQILILQALAEVAAIEGCGVVVEGIETEGQLQAIKQLKCEALQGFALARPMAEDDFLKALQRAAAE